MAAAASGVAVPSTTLEWLGIAPEADPEALKRFRTRYPVRTTHDEDGARLAAAPASATGTPWEAEDDDLVLEEVDG